MTLERVTGPASEPVSLAEAKAHLRVDHDDEDQHITRLIMAAREAAERYTGRAFMTQSWRMWLDAWPVSTPRVIIVPKPPLIAVQSVTAHDRAGQATTLSADAYLVDTAAAPARIVFKETAALPADLREANAVGVIFEAGYGADAGSVPAGIRAGILALVAHFYEARGDGGMPSAPALAALNPYRVMML